LIRVLICDDSAEARAGLRTMLADHDEIQIVGEASNGEEAVARAGELAPDVVLMDVRMPMVDGIEATRRIARQVPLARVVALSGADDADSIDEMLAAGAAAYLVKGAPLWELERAIAGGGDPLVRLALGLAKATGRRASVATIVARELAELTGAAAAAAYLAAPDVALSLVGVARELSGSLTFPPPHPPALARRVFETQTPARADEDELDELRLLGLSCGSAYAVPLRSDGEMLGSLLVVMPAGCGLGADEALVADVGALAATAFATERRLALTHAEARRDAVTGVANRRAFDERLAESLRDAVTRRRELSVTLFDLDDFKRVNDACGHAQGDAVLVQVARTALRVLRPGEELFRVGGDEFALVVLAGTGIAVGIGERIQAAVREQARTSPLPTISAGVATFPADARSAGDLVCAADAALRASKRNGKQRISAAGAPAIARRSGPRRSAAVGAREPGSPSAESRGARVLFVDDDPATLTLLGATFELIDIQVSQASSAAEAMSAVAASPPDVVVLDIGLPDVDGLTLCRRLKDDPATSWIGVVLLTGAGMEAEPPARAAGADAFLLKPFSPLELLAVVERLAGGLYEGPFRAGTEGGDEQLLRYAGDLRRLLQIERGRQELVQRTYRQTVAALAGALETKDIGTGSHSQRVRRYAVELARTLDPSLLDNASVEYGFLLHDVGKIGIPDHVLQKRGPLDGAEQQLMRTHTVLGEQLLGDVDLLHGDGLKVVRGHHERWDGRGYPDGLAGTDIPLAARVFAVADTLDAMTSDRPYRAARSWDEAAAEILCERGRQFDPDVVDVFRQRERELHEIRRELTAV